jgi:hypothetical protein
MWWLLGIAVFALLFSLAKYSGVSAQEEVDRAVSMLIDHHPLSVAPGAEVDERRLAGLTAFQYEDVKKELGMGGEFCIYLEDANGQIIPLAGNPGLGSSEILIDDRPCRWG